MAPAQALTNADEDRKSDVLVKIEPRESEEVKISAGLNNAGEENVSEIFDPLVNLISDGGDLDPLVHRLSTADDDVNEEELDVIDWPGDADARLVKDEDLDGTECSSSFGESFGSDCESKREELSDFEAESPFPASNDDPVIMDGDNRVFKKKKVTGNWRKYVSPLTWRCQWLELKIKELNVRSLRYDTELASYKHEKDLQSKMVELDSSVSRSVPVAYRKNNSKVMKRRKRKRNEDLIDVSSYMSNHPIFSYYENKRTETDGHSVDDDCGDVAEENNKGNDDNEWLLGSKGNDCHVEQLLLNIDVIQTRVLKLKAHLNKVMCRNTKEISSSHGNILSIDQPASYVHSVSGSPRNNGEAMLAGILTPPQQVSEFEMDDVVMPDSAVSSYGDAADLDIIGNTLGILAGDVVLGQHHVGDLCRENADDVLIDNNQVPEEEYQNLEKLSHAKGNIQVSVKKEEAHSEDESIAPDVPIPRSGSSGETGSASQRTALKPGYTGKKRGRKPKKRRRGAPVVTTPSVSASVPWRSERLLKKRRLQGKKG